MKKPGPQLEALIDRLTAIPGDFFKPDGKLKNSGSGVSIPALVNDMLLDNGGTPFSDDEILKRFSDKNELKNKKSIFPELVSILSYIFEDKFFTGEKNSAELIKAFLLSPGLKDLSEAVESSEDFINDPDRREELCRMALNALNYYPDGETEKNAGDRLLTLDSVERKKILVKTREAQLRAKQLKEAMMAREAEEAASKMSRE